MKLKILAAVIISSFITSVVAEESQPESPVDTGRTLHWAPTVDISGSIIDSLLALDLSIGLTSNGNFDPKVPFLNTQSPITNWYTFNAAEEPLEYLFQPLSQASQNPQEGDSYNISLPLANFPDILGSALVGLEHGWDSGAANYFQSALSYDVTVDSIIPYATNIIFSPANGRLNIEDSGILNFTGTTTFGGGFLGDGIVNLDGEILGAAASIEGASLTGELINRTTLNINSGDITVAQLINQGNGEIIVTGNSSIRTSAPDFLNESDLLVKDNGNLTLGFAQDFVGSFDPMLDFITIDNEAGRMEAINGGSFLIENLMTINGGNIDLFRGSIVGASSGVANTLTLNDTELLTLAGNNRLGADNLHIINQGLIIADGSTLIIDPNADGFVNEGTMQARNGGTLSLRDGTYDTTQGSLSADNDSALDIQSSTVDATGQSVSGGRISIAGSSVAVARLTADNALSIGGSNMNVSEVTLNSGKAALSNVEFQQDVTLNGDYRVTNPSYRRGNPASTNDIDFAGDLTNTGSVTLYTQTYSAYRTDGGHSRIVFDKENTVLDGGGEIRLNDVGEGAPFIIGKDGTEKLTIKEQSIIAESGSGYLGNDTLSIVNEGNLIADGGTLIIDPNADGFVNEGTMQARNGGTINVVDDFSSSGLILIDLGASLNGKVVDLHGGELKLNGLITADNLNIYGGLLSGSGTINSNVSLFGGAIAPGNSPAQLEITGDLTLGVGSILNFEFAGTSLGLFDQLLIGGDLFIGDGITLNISFLDGFSFSDGDLFELFNVSGDVFGDFSSIGFNILGDYSFDFEARYENGAFLFDVLSDNVFVQPANPVNAPSSFVLILLSLIIFINRRKALTIH
jgi:hypothetical protein